MERFFMIGDCLYNLRQLKNIETHKNWLPGKQNEPFVSMRIRFYDSNAISVLRSDPLMDFKIWLEDDSPLFDFDKAIMALMEDDSSKNYITKLDHE